MENLEEYAERLKNIRRRNVGRQNLLKRIFILMIINGI